MNNNKVTILYLRFCRIEGLRTVLLYLTRVVRIGIRAPRRQRPAITRIIRYLDYPARTFIFCSPGAPWLRRGSNFLHPRRLASHSLTTCLPAFLLHLQSHPHSSFLFLLSASLLFRCLTTEIHTFVVHSMLPPPSFRFLPRGTWPPWYPVPKPGDKEFVQGGRHQ